MSGKKLIPLNEYNEAKIAAHNLSIKRWNVPNGLACPECGCELVDVDPMMVLGGQPPQLDVFCTSCRFQGYRIE
jgi:hypothetical protein